ncbi:MAG: pseudouridine synthase [Candidatus Staskawiczbacteria bacterium]|nr:pseudouridine synthase [Candidatus Staskawiczbacteria bacterium]
MEYPIRINKYLRDKGLASRRESDKLVESGLVFVNGKRADNGAMINEKDNVIVKKPKGLIAKEYKYLAYYKPRNLSTQDLPGKESVITLFRKDGVYPIGRLDKSSEGLLLLTNDGRFARKVLSVDSKYEKEYLVTVKEPLRVGVVKIFKEGMDTQALGKLLPAKSRIVNNNKIQVILNEGKRHQIRVMFNELSYTISSLKRVRIGDIKIGDLKSGETRPIKISYNN